MTAVPQPSIAPTWWLSTLILLSALLTFGAALATVVWHADQVGVAGGLVALALLGLARWSR